MTLYIKPNIVCETKYCKLFCPQCSTRVISRYVEVYPAVCSSPYLQHVSGRKKYVPQIYPALDSKCRVWQTPLSWVLNLYSCVKGEGARESEVFPFAFLSGSAFSGKWRRKSRRSARWVGLGVWGINGKSTWVGVCWEPYRTGGDVSFCAGWLCSCVKVYHPTCPCYSAPMSRAFFIFPIYERPVIVMASTFREILI
jgi:hypothetical protein